LNVQGGPKKPKPMCLTAYLLKNDGDGSIYPNVMTSYWCSIVKIGIARKKLKVGLQSQERLLWTK